MYAGDFSPGWTQVSFNLFKDMLRSFLLRK